MTLKSDLLGKGYLPENLPPSFGSAEMGEYFEYADPTSYYSNAKNPTRPAIYSASKRGLNRRAFVVVHPRTGYDLANFVDAHEEQFRQHFSTAHFSQSSPQHTPDGVRAVEIASYSALERTLRTTMAPYRFVARTDVSRFYHSIYTHTIPWALHGKAAAKTDRRPNAAELPFNRLDWVIRAGQDGQTVGIPVGPDASRFVAEAIATSIDAEFLERHPDFQGRVIRHVDDVWLGTDSHIEAENALWHYREAMRAYELDVNESKTRILSTDFRISEAWPTDIAAKLDYANNSDTRWREDRLGAALDHIFQEAIRTEDDGLLKYAIKYIDQSDFGWSDWDLLEAFLKRCAVHFGHTLDYVVRVLTWRHLVEGDVDRDAWGAILASLLRRHGRMGNDSEVCWLLYAALRLRVEIDEETANDIAASCNALAVVSLLHCVQNGLVRRRIFSVVRDRLADEAGSGSWWPVILEWHSRQWPRPGRIRIKDDLLQDMINREVSIFNPDRLTSVFSAVGDDYTDVPRAIERRVSLYDHDEFDPSDFDDTEGE